MQCDKYFVKFLVYNAVLYPVLGVFLLFFALMTLYLFEVFIRKLNIAYILKFFHIVLLSFCTFCCSFVGLSDNLPVYTFDSNCTGSEDQLADCSTIINNSTCSSGLIAITCNGKLA